VTLTRHLIVFMCFI